MKNLDKQYSPADFEAKTYAQWEDAGVFEPTGKGEPYTIMLPPPNVTGVLHMGHALQDTIMDILARRARMLGKDVLWQPGTDSAALPTNKIIQEKLEAEGKTREDVGREQYVKLADEWYQQTGSEILNQMKRLGASCAWNRSVFTLDPEYVKAINEAFLEYYQRGYIYRGSRIVNWDPKTQTTVSDLEIEYQTEKGNFYYFQYGPFEIGTARPETKFSDKYVVVHPDDERYAEYKHGDTFECEWINGPIKATIIKDEASDPSVGSGAMTITPWHSQIDFELAQKHDLDMEQIIDFDGKLLPVAGEFAGMPIEEAREKIVQKLDEKGLLNRVDEKYEHNVAVNDRGKGTIEPQVMRQWFVDMSKLKEQTIKAAEDEDVKFVPKRWKKHFVSWMENVYDWNINRQIWLGHRLPVWWKKGTHGTDNEEGNFVVQLDSPGQEYEQDPDTLDTWFSSALWPLGTLGWPRDSKELERYYPTDVLVTARDILYLWVARMVFSGLELVKDIPFKEVFIHPTVLTKDGKRMSKSLGTGIDPLELIEEYSADALRFGLMSQMSFDSQAIKFDETDVTAGRNFANKIWNMARLLQGLEGRDERSTADDWIEGQLSELISRVNKNLDEYRIGEALDEIYNFIWKDFADWYLEILKHEGLVEVAKKVFVTTLQLLHPFMPFVTEVLWDSFGQEGMVALSQWPSAEAFSTKKDAEKGMAVFKDIVSSAREARRYLKISPGEEVSLAVKHPVLETALGKIARAKLVDTDESLLRWPLASGGAIGIGSATIDEAAKENARAELSKEKEELAVKISKQEGLLKQMAERAPQEVIDEKKAELATWQARTNAVDNILLYLGTDK